LLFILLQAQVPLKIFDYSYKTSFAVAEDILFTFAVVALLTTVYPILNSQKSVSDLLEFMIGTIIGFGIALIFLPLFVKGIFIFILALIFYMIGFGKSTTGYYGLIFGYFAMFPLMFPLIIPLRLGFVFWLVFSYGMGTVLGCAISCKTDIFVWSVPLPLIFLYFQFLLNIIYGFFVLFGAVLVLLSVHDSRKTLKVLSIIILLAIFYLVIGNFYSTIVMYICTIVIILGLGQITTFELYKKDIRLLFRYWLQSKVRAKGNGINISKFEIIPDFGKVRVTKKSFFFVYLSHLLLNHLKQEGFDVEIIDKADNQDIIIRDIFINFKG